MILNKKKMAGKWQDYDRSTTYTTVQQLILEKVYTVAYVLIRNPD